MKNSADTVKHMSMELGGHAPLIVDEDADLDLAVAQTMASKFRNAYQTCVCANLADRTRIRERRVCEKLSEEAAKLKVGNGLEKGVNVGPVINKKASIKSSAKLMTPWKKAQKC